MQAAKRDWTNLDIAAFSQLLISGPPRGDLNGDLAVNNLDITPFAQLLTAGPAAPAGVLREPPH